MHVCVDTYICTFIIEILCVCVIDLDPLVEVSIAEMKFQSTVCIVQTPPG